MHVFKVGFILKEWESTELGDAADMTEERLPE